MENDKTKQSFGNNNFLSVITAIDELPQDVSTELRGIVYTLEKNGTSRDTRKNDNILKLIEYGYLEDRTDEKNILETKYSKDALFRELSKKVYDIQPNSNTTKREMIEYILQNDRALGNLVYKKWITVGYAKEFEVWVKELADFLDDLIETHPYKTVEIKLVDFYNERKNNPNYKTDGNNMITKNVEIQLNIPQTVRTKDKKIALLLCIFGGYLGLHDFYAGKIGKGVLYLCTGGIFFVGWIIDIIKIANDTYTDKNGYRLKK